MKKGLLFFLVFCLCFSFSGCGKSKAVIEADTLIASIGKVTLESNGTLQAAQQAVSNLTDRQKKQLENAALLDSAQDTYDKLLTAKVEQAIAAIGSVTLDSGKAIEKARKLYDGCSKEVRSAISNYAILQEAENEFSQQKVNNVINLINQIGTITVNSGDKIAAAQTAYNALSAEEKSNVSNYATLQEAENEFSQQKVNNVINLINQIGTITVNSGDKIAAAQTAYNALSAEEKSNVSNYKTLSEAPQKLKAEKRQNATAKLKSETDKVEGTTWYKAKVNPDYANVRSYALPYIGTSSGFTWLRLKYLYTGDSWIFFKSITISVDGKRYEAEFSYWDVERDNNTDVWEWVDVSATDADIEMLKAIANSKETIVRFRGDQYHYDLVVSQSDKNGIKDVLAAYEAMK